MKIVHRDVKPANLLLQGENPMLKLCDFGLAARVKPRQLLQESCGALGFRAPEHLLCETPFSQGGYSCENDIWSAGLNMYMMVTGEFPFLSSTGEFDQAAALKGLRPSLANQNHAAKFLGKDEALEFCCSLVSHINSRPSAYAAMKKCKATFGHLWITRLQKAHDSLRERTSKKLEQYLKALAANPGMSLVDLAKKEKVRTDNATWRHAVQFHKQSLKNSNESGKRGRLVIDGEERLVIVKKGRLDIHDLIEQGLL